jgi:hypothetical protein
MEYNAAGFGSVGAICLTRRLRMDAHDFQNPPREYREIPFRSWSDALDPLELRLQVRLRLFDS